MKEIDEHPLLTGHTTPEVLPVWLWLLWANGGPNPSLSTRWWKVRFSNLLSFPYSLWKVGSDESNKA